MLMFILRRSLLALLTIWALSVISFVIIQLPPGDFVDTYIQELMFGNVATGAAIGGGKFETTLREQFGLDKPIHVQYAKWAVKLVQGDFGQSLEYQKPVSEIVSERLLMTVILAGTPALFSWALSIPIGIYSAVR